MTRLKYVRADYLMTHYPDVYRSLDEVARVNRATYTMQRCLRAVCLAYGVTPEEIRSKCRERHIAVPRHHFCWVVYRNRIDMSYPMIARFLNRDHTTIVHSVEVFEEVKHMMSQEIFAVEKFIHDDASKTLTLNVNRERLTA